MSKKTIDLQQIRKRIISEKKTGDVTRAGRKANISCQIFYTAMKKEKYDDLTDAECRMVTALLEILDERAEMKKKLIPQYAN